MAIDSPINISGINGSISSPGIDGNRGGATTSYSFLTGVLSPDFTNTRASVGSFYNSSGLIAQAANNTPRFDYDPVTLVLKGLLLEGQSTNLITNNLNMAAGSWGQNSVNVSASGSPSPDGSNDAFNIIPILSNGYHAVWSNVATPFTPGSPYAISFFGKQSGYNLAQISSAYIPAPFTNEVVDIYNDVGLAGNCIVSHSSNGFARASAAIVAPSLSVLPCLTPAGLLSQTTGSSPAQYLADGVSGITVFGMQAEAGDLATSLIITGSTTATRMADLLVNTSIPWFKATAGTFIVEFISPSIIEPYQSVAAFSDGTSNNKLEIFGGYTAGNGLLTCINGGTTYNSAGFSVTPSAIHKIALSYGPTVYGAIDGVAVAAISGAVLPAGINQLNIGSNSLGQPLNGWIRKFTYYNTQLSPSQILQATS